MSASARRPTIATRTSVHETFGLRLRSASAGHAVVSAHVSSWLSGVDGLTAAGAAAVVADSALVSAAATTVATDLAVTTIRLRLDHLAPVGAETTTLRASATVDDASRTGLLVHCEVTDEAGRPVTRASARCLAVPRQGPQADRPVVRGRRTRDPGGAAALAGWVAAGRPPLRGSTPAAGGPPLATWLSLTAERDADGELLVSVPAWPWLANSAGTLMGGVTALIAEQALTLAAMTASPARAPICPADLHVVYLRPVTADGAMLLCLPRVLRGGRRVIDVTVDLIDAGGALVATAHATYLRRQWAGAD